MCLSYNCKMDNGSKSHIIAADRNPPRGKPLIPAKRAREFFGLISTCPVWDPSAALRSSQRPASIRTSDA